MHATVQKILESRGVPDQTRYPTGAYAIKTYQTLADELFPHLAIPEDGNSTLCDEMLAFTKLRKKFSPLGIRLTSSDVRSPDPIRLGYHLDRIGAYADRRDQQLHDPDSLANECARSLVKLKSKNNEQQRLEKEYQELENQLSKDRAEYSALQQQNRENIKYVKDKYAECKGLSAHASQKNKSLEEKAKEIVRVNAAIKTTREAIETLKPYIDEKTGQIKSAKSDIQRLEGELRSVMAQLQEFVESSVQLEDALATLAGIREQLAALENTFKAYKQQSEVLEAAKREKSALRTESERNRRQLTTLENTIQTLEGQMEQLEQQESKLLEELDHSTQEWIRAIATLEAEESTLVEEIAALRKSTHSLEEKLNNQREHRDELKTFLEESPGKLKYVRSELDKALDDITNTKLPPPKIIKPKTPSLDEA